MDIKLILENQLVIMHAMAELGITGLREQIRKTQERLDRWGSEA